MTRYLVTTPEPGHSGLIGGVHFDNGVAEVDDATHAAELGYMRGAGYHVREAVADDVSVAEPDAVEDIEPVEPDAAKPKKTATVGEWRTYATTQGMSAEDADGMTKNQLVERFADSDPEEGNE